jgi:transcriptional regulator with XRE-family HTH domain
MLTMNATFGDVIREAREHHHWLGRELAAKVEVDPGTLSRIENNKYKETPPPDLVRRFSAVLNIPERDLVAALGYRITDGGPEPMPVFDPARAELLDKLERCRLDDQTRITTLRFVLDGWLRQDREAEHPVKDLVVDPDDRGPVSRNRNLASDEP